jgi:hypothetical protein
MRLNTAASSVACRVKDNSARRVRRAHAQWWGLRGIGVPDGAPVNASQDTAKECADQFKLPPAP